MKMKAQRPALGISLSESWGDTHVYHVECSCTSSDHAVTAWIEVQPDEDVPEVEVTFYITTNFRRWEGIFERVKLAWRILLGKGHEQHHSLLLNQQAALNFSAAIEASIKDLESRDITNT